MLVFTKINPSGLFSYGISDTISLSVAGLVHLKGVNEDKDADSNGSGKSSLFNALCEIVWGENPSGVSGAGCINNVLGRGFCGRVEFICGDGSLYRVTYAREWKGELYPVDNDNGVVYSGTSVFFDVFKDGQWCDLRGASMAETRKIIQNTIGLTHERFLASSYLSPRTGNLILKGSNKDRMEIMSGIVGLSDWDRVLDEAKAARRSVQAQVSEVEKKLSFVEGVYSEALSERERLAATDWQKYITEHVEYAEKVCAQANELEVQQSDVFSQLQSAMQLRSIGSTPLKNEISNLSREISLLESRSREPLLETDEMKALSGSIRSTEGELSVADGKLRSYKSGSAYFGDTAELRSLASEIRLLEVELSTFEAKLRSFKSKDGATLELTACPTCGSEENWDRIKGQMAELQEEIEGGVSSCTKELEEKQAAFDAALEANKALLLSSVEAEIASLKALVSSKRVEYHALVEAQQEARKAYVDEGAAAASGLRSKAAELEAQVRIVEAQAAEIERQITSLNVKHRELGAQVSCLRADHSQALSRIEQYRGSLSRLEDLQVRVLAKAAEMAELQSEIDKLHGDGDYYEWLIKHAPFIKLHKLSVSLVELSSIVNRYLGDIGDSIRVNISSFSEKKGKVKGPLADSLKSEVELSITDGEKVIDPRLYSDGEIGRVSLAVARALHDMAVKNGNGCNLTFLDEVFSYVDHASSQKMSSLFSKVDGTVVITDNSSRASDLLNFDEVWVARKKQGITTLEVC